MDRPLTEQDRKSKGRDHLGSAPVEAARVVAPPPFHPDSCKASPRPPLAHYGWDKPIRAPGAESCLLHGDSMSLEITREQRQLCGSLLRNHSNNGGGVGIPGRDSTRRSAEILRSSVRRLRIAIGRGSCHSSLMQPFREKSLHRFLPEIPRNSHVNSNRKFQTGMSEFESSLVSQPVRSLPLATPMSQRIRRCGAFRLRLAVSECPNGGSGA